MLAELKTGTPEWQQMNVELLDHEERALGFVAALKKQFINNECEISKGTHSIWNSLGLAEAVLDYILDSGKFDRAPEVYEKTVDYLTGHSKHRPLEITHDRAIAMVEDAEEGMFALDEDVLARIRDRALQIGQIDAAIKVAKDPAELAWLRTLEGVLEVEIFAEAIPQEERDSCPDFEAAVDSIGKLVGYMNIEDSAEDFEEDKGKAHQLPAAEDKAALYGILNQIDEGKRH